MDPKEAGERILIIAPHPDDEALGTAGIIYESIRRSLQVLIVIVTSGDGSLKACEELSQGNDVSPEIYRRVGMLRCNESKRAMMKLGVPRKNVVFLGFADGSVNSLWDTNWDMSRLHTGLNGCSHSPYRFSYLRGVPFCGKALAENFKAIITRFKPTSIFYPDPEDNHHDHWAVNAFVQYALTETGYQAKEFTYLVHRRDFPYPRGHAPYHGLFPPPSLAQRKEKWLVLPLCTETIRMKEKITHIYTIPMAIIPELLISFIRRNELFAVPAPRKLAAERKEKSAVSAQVYTTATIDPKGDTFSGSILAGDIRKLSLTKKSRTIGLRLELAEEPCRDFIYRMHLRIFTKKKTSRLDINITAGGYRIETPASNSVHTGNIKSLTKGNTIEVEIPGNIAEGAFCLLAGADVLVNGRIYDRCAWERVQIE